MAHRDEDRLSGRHNSLNAVRLLLALIVVVSHVPKVRGDRPLMVGDLEIGGWAVAGFFGVSGWLVTQSRLRLPVGQFLWRRSLRIFPGFWACLAATALLAAPVAAAADQVGWRPWSALRYVFANLTLVIVDARVGQTLHGRPDPSTWNLSLWTLSYEFLCYLGIALLLTWSLARRRVEVTVAAFLLVSACNAALVWLGAARDTTPALTFRLTTFFLAGAVLLRLKRVPLVAAGAAIATVVLVAAAATDQVRVFGALPIAYLCLWLGRVLPLTWLGRRNDVSYGVYLYAFPVQQLLTITAVHRLPTAGFAAASIVAVLPVAWLNWVLVERPALRLKGFPGAIAIRGRSSPGPAARGEPAVPGEHPVPENDVALVQPPR